MSITDTMSPIRAEEDEAVNVLANLLVQNYPTHKPALIRAVLDGDYEVAVIVAVEEGPDMVNMTPMAVMLDDTLIDRLTPAGDEERIKDEVTS